MHKKTTNFSSRYVKIILDFFAKVLYNIKCNFAGVVELADAPDSKSGGSDTMRVRPPPPAPKGAVKKVPKIKIDYESKKVLIVFFCGIIELLKQ